MILISILFVSCERNFSENLNSKVTLQLPIASTNKVSSQSVETFDFNTTRPASIDDFNCYGLFVSGPEPEMQDNSCGRKSDPNYPKRKVGLIGGGALIGSSLNVTVPSGNDRVFTLVGFKTQDNYCPDFKSGTMDNTKMSKPYIIGEVGRVGLVAGENKSLQIQMKFDANSWFDDCQGPEFNLVSNGEDPNNDGPVNDGPIATEPNQIRLDIPVGDFSSSSSQMIHEVCYPVVIELLKDSQSAPSPGARTVALIETTTNGYLPGYQKFYTDYLSCSQNLVGARVTAIPFSTNEWRKIFFVRSIYNSNMEARIKASTLNLSTGASIVSNEVVYYIRYLDPNYVNNLLVSRDTFGFTNTNNGYKFSCNEVYVYPAHLGSGPSTWIISTDTFAINLSFTFSITQGVQNNFFVSSSCQNNTEVSTLAIPIGQSFARLGLWKKDPQVSSLGVLVITGSNVNNTSQTFTKSVNIID